MMYNKGHETMSNKHFKIELPAYWCNVLINGDGYSGLDREVLDAVIAWQRDNPNVCIELCSDESYIGHYDGLMCDMLTYEGYYTI